MAKKTRANKLQSEKCTHLPQGIMHGNLSTEHTFHPACLGSGVNWQQQSLPSSGFCPSPVHDGIRVMTEYGWHALRLCLMITHIFCH